MMTSRHAAARRRLTIDRIAARPELVLGLNRRRTAKLIMSAMDAVRVLCDHLADLTGRRQARRPVIDDCDPDRVLN